MDISARLSPRTCAGRFAVSPLLVFLLALSGTAADAHQPLRPQSEEELRAYLETPQLAPYNEKFLVEKADEMVKIRGAHVAWADYAALRRDFENLRTLDDAAVDAWILENFAYISRGQLPLNGIRNSPIPVAENDVRTGYRPERWNRAAILPHPSGGAVDLKGAGHPAHSSSVRRQLEKFRGAIGNVLEIDQLRIRDHSDGLMSLGEAIAETTRQQAAQKLFDIQNAKSASNLQTVESYFILDLPFHILKDDGKSVPAALYGRQAHIGREHYLPVPRHIYTDEFGGLQRDRFGAAVDFGAVQIRDSRLTNRFGMPQPGDFNAQKSNPWVWAHEVAEAVTRQINPDREAINRHIAQMLEPIEEAWRAADKTRTAAIHANAEALLLTLREWRLEDPRWFSELGERLANAGPDQLRFVDHLVAGRQLTTDQIARIAGVLQDSSARPASRLAAAHLLAVGRHTIPVEKFSRLPRSERRFLAPFLSSYDSETLQDLASSLNRSNSGASRGWAAVRVAELIHEGRAPKVWRNDERLIRLLAESMSDVPSHLARRNIYKSLVSGKPGKMRIPDDAIMKIALGDPYLFLRNQALADLSEKPELGRKWYKTLLDAFDHESMPDNRIQLANILVRARPDDPLLHVKLLRAAEEESPQKRLAFLSFLEGRKISHPEARAILHRLAAHQDRDLAQAAQLLGGQAPACSGAFQALSP